MHKPWAVRPDRERNRLYLTITGIGFENRIDELEAELRQATHQLRWGFEIINDMTDVPVLTEKLAERLSATAQHLREWGSRRSVRVVSTGLMKLQARRIIAAKGLSEVHLATSVEEAEALLDWLHEQEKAHA